MKKLTPENTAPIQEARLRSILGGTSDTTTPDTLRVAQVTSSNMDTVINLIR